MNGAAMSQLSTELSANEGWAFSAFGGNTSPERNPDPIWTEDGVTLLATGGKLASGDEGLSYYFQELPSDLNFELRATAVVKSFNSNSGISTPNQKSFGLMLKDSVGDHRNSSTHTSSYLAVGALDTVMKGFYKQGTQAKFDPYPNNTLPGANEEYELIIKKSGDTYLVGSNGESDTITIEGLFTEQLYAGVYVARDAEVSFQNLEISIDERQVNELRVNASAMKTTYLVGEALDLDGLEVTAVLSSGEEILLQPDDYLVTGFDSSTAGTTNLTIHYNGATVPLELTIKDLQLTSMEIKYYPAKTTYFIGDTFHEDGMEVLGIYDDGAREESLSPEQYRVVIDGVQGEKVTFEEGGTKTVSVVSTLFPEVATDFDITVKDAVLEGLEVRNLPEKILYYLGEELDLDGINVYANYEDGSSVRLMKNEFTVSELDTSLPGIQEVTLSHKNKTIAFNVKIKEKELLGIQLTSYPKTTYFIGETFEPSGMEISKAYDNGDLEPMPDRDYTLDTSGYNSETAGERQVEIIPNDSNLSSIFLPITVREDKNYEWKSIRFGQSTSDEKNYLREKEDGNVELIALEGGGKVTGDHDGIIFYYTEVDAEEDNFRLSANIKVLDFAKNPHDGQESFGIMARDAIGQARNSAVFASNIAAIGGFSGGTREEIGTQGFIRTGVESPDGAGSQGIQKAMLQKERPGAGNTHPAKDYELVLEKTNSGYLMKLNDEKETLYYQPEILQVQDSKIYVGFYAARLATIEMSDIDFTVTASKTDAPKVEAPQERFAPELAVVSLDKVSKTDYTLRLKANVDGTATIKQGLTNLTQDEEVLNGQVFDVHTDIEANANTNFSISFLPDDTEYLTSYEKIIRNFTVTMKTFGEGGDIHVSTEGKSSNSGTLKSPIDLDTAIDFVKEGQKIIVAEGHYVRSGKVEIKKYNDGTAQAKKYLEAAPGTRPVIDFDKRTEGVVLSGDHWHIKGLDFKRSAGNTKGFTVGGNHNIVENSRFYEHGDTGLQISRTDGSDNKEDWPSHNLILNSTSFDNRDPSENNADGFAAKLTVGLGNIFRGCIAHNNIDDGWDLYTKAGTGAIGAVLIEDSIAYNNGFLTDGTVGAGDQNGFKLGGEGIHVPHVIKNSLAFGNGSYGFTSNSNPGVIAINNKAFNNGNANLNFTTYSHIQSDFTVEGFYSYQKDYDYTVRDQYPSRLAAFNNYLFDGQVSKNSVGIELKEGSFKSIEPKFPYQRDEEGNIIWGDFMELSLVDSEVTVTPKVLNTKGLKDQPHGKEPVVTVRITMAEEREVEMVNPDTIFLNQKVKPQEATTDKNHYIMKFSRNELADLLERGPNIPITITGALTTGKMIQGTTEITVK